MNAPASSQRQFPLGRWRFDFMGHRRTAAVLSSVLLLVAIGSLATRGLNFGIDFTGGTLVEVEYAEAFDPAGVRSRLRERGLEDAAVQPFGSADAALIRLPPLASEIARAEVGDRLLEILSEGGEEVAMRRIEFVGPKVGEELSRAGAWAMLYALGGILIYITLRFQARFSLGAITALMHDVLIVLGLFSLSGLDFDLSVLAALLAVVGYSLNDTIVVFDRVRENFRRMHRAAPIEVINVSLNQTLARTLVTSLTTLLVLFSLLLFGGEIIRPFSIALIAGVLIGTYSSLYVASPVTLALGISRQDLIAVAKEKGGAQV